MQQVLAGVAADPEVQDQPAAALGGLTGFDTYVPVIMVLGLTMLTRPGSRSPACWPSAGCSPSGC